MSLSLLPQDAAIAAGLSSSLSPVKASQACLSCRKQKRKCDKLLPACGLCGRMGRQCDYTTDVNTAAQPAPTAEDLAALQLRLMELENRLNRDKDQASPDSSSINPSSGGGGGGSSRPSVNTTRGSLWLPAGSSNGIGSNNSFGMMRFPSAIFLDIDCFRWAGMPIPKPNVDIPTEVYEILSRGDTVQESIAEYFRSIHTWFPIVSRKRMSLGIPLWDGGPDLAMLFMAMKLVTTQPVEGIASADCPLYTASKRFLSLLESAGTVSLLYLQGLILVTLYEFGHGIYPAAWMSVAACSRYADVIGIPSFRDSSAILGSCTTWTEAEERRRVWWGVYILDRAISLGNKKRFSAPDPMESTILPTDDTAWDEGDMTRALQQPVSTPFTSPQAPFARLCQSALLISRVTRHCTSSIRNHLSGNKHPFNLSDVTALLNDVTSFIALLDTQLSHSHDHIFFGLLAPRCLTFSALVMLLDIYSCPENLRDGPAAGAGSGPGQCGGGDYDMLLADGHFGGKSADELTMQVTAVNGLKEASLRIRDLSIDLLDAVVLPAEQKRTSPLCLDSLYCAMATLHWLWKEAGDPDIQSALEDVKRCLSRLAMRWRLAREYLGLEQHHDNTTAMTWRAAHG
ncbi:hypothetical protein QBC46DRAFT_372049 [Diplogelasinospora grovesii]|uniref:Zn(2)-C6 fungal-type domain-containing protein n=1 Tax=Diplogelasinospora grovesii TaxID=303347 RepID=A0AAN6NJX0_9PEZI|nr:hypothetical protein QBC46DRAFT_372049 [Diplogelasinospora grovesii]